MSAGNVLPSENFLYNIVSHVALFFKSLRIRRISEFSSSEPDVFQISIKVMEI
jgi:hypothetical protein